MGMEKRGGVGFVRPGTQKRGARFARVAGCPRMLQCVSGERLV